jgi:hypothetical protein
MSTSEAAPPPPPPGTTNPPPPPSGSAPARRSVPVGWVVLVVVGALISLLSLAPLAGGGFLLWANATQRDDDGYFATSAERFDTTEYAITSEEIDLGTVDQANPVDLADIATVRLDVTPDGEEPIFVGIGPEQQVNRYLRGVGVAQVDDLRFDPFRIRYRYESGGPPANPPGEEDLWVASIEGSGAQRLTWEPDVGNWTLVVMNADGSANVSADVAFGVRSPWVFRIGLILAIVGGVGLVIGAAMLVVGIIGLARGSHIDLTAHEGHPERPVRIEGGLDEPLSRWLWLVKWFLLIPHFIVLAVLWLAFFVVTVVAFFAILFTERYPRSLFEFNVGVLRWTWRVVYYGYSALGTDRYPPFRLGPEPDYPATYDVDYPERLSRGLVLIKWWLLAIPHYIVLAIIGGGLGLGWGADRGWNVPFGGFIGVVVLFVGLALLFTGSYPRGLFDLVMGLNRWVYRVIPYVALMRDEYPPFRLDQGGSEPNPPPSPPTAPGGGRTESPHETVPAGAIGES